MAIVAKLQVVVVVALFAVACGSSSEEEIKIAPAPHQEPTHKPVAPVPAQPAPTDSLRLPSWTVDTSKIIWRSKAEVEKVLGPGTKRPDGKWRHDIKDGNGFVVVIYDKGLAVGVETPTVLGKPPFTDEQHERIAAFFMLPRDSKARGRTIVAGNSFLGTSLAAYEEKYINELEAKAEVARAREEAASVLKRRVHLAELSKAMAAKGLDARFEMGATNDEVRYFGICTQALLDDLANRMRPSFYALGFRRMTCSVYAASLE
ncbi:MAG: hypothetical protein ACTHU0_29550 [Kofleriaceae bacterium]